MSFTAKLIEHYNTRLMASNPVRSLVAAVAQDPQNETVDLVKSRISVRQTARDLGRDVHDARRQIIAWLNSVYFTGLDVVIQNQWWWEMHTRIQKLLIVSMVLEGDNLRSFGATPQGDDIPQCLFWLQSEINNQRTRFQKRADEYGAEIRKLQTDEAFGRPYLNLYLNDEE